MKTQVKDEVVQGAPPATAAPDAPARQIEESAALLARLKLLAPVARQDRDLPPAEPAPAPAPAVEKPAPKRSALRQELRVAARRVATLLVALVAVLISLLAWDQYLTSPWTRDGRVRVQVASVAPEVSGQIQELRVADNQFVHKGDVLYVIDRFDFDVAVRSSQAALQQKAADVQVKKQQSERRRQLSSLATTPEQQQVFAGNAVQADAAFQAAQQQLAQAEINLKRTEVRSPVNGFVTNLLLRPGDYARVGAPNISIIDADSFWIDGYFEETKMARVCTGSRVEAKLMGYAQPILGHVKTVTRGLSVSNAASGAQGLPNVDPIYTWVRLAQRVPVRIAIDEVPPGIPLVSGMTATVTIRDDSADRSTWFDRARASLSNVFNGPSGRPGCIPAVTADRGPTQSIPGWTVQPTPTAEQINPGLAPGIQTSPRYD